MSNDTHSKKASKAKAVLGHQLNDDGDDSFNQNPSMMSNFNKQSDQSSEDFLSRNVKTLHGSTISEHCRFRNLNLSSLTRREVFANSHYCNREWP